MSKALLTITFILFGLYYTSGQNQIQPFSYNGGYLSKVSVKQSHPNSQSKEINESVLVDIIVNYKDGIPYGYIEVRYPGVTQKDGLSPKITYNVNPVKAEFLFLQDQDSGIMFEVKMNRAGYTSAQKHKVVVFYDDQKVVSEILIIDHFDTSFSMAQKWSLRSLSKL